MFILNLLLFLVALSLLIFIHEFGHFLFAKLFNVYCMEFSLGMGPAIFSKKIKKDPETLYSLRWLPIGGYVAMAGEVEDDEKEKNLNIPYERTINGIKAWKRAIVVVAGVTFNFIFALILIAIYIFASGVDSKDNRVSISSNSIAYNAGIRSGDKIVEISNNVITENGNIIYTSCSNEICKVNTVSELVEIVNASTPSSDNKMQQITLNYYHNEELKTAILTRTFDSDTQAAQIFGVSAYSVTPGFFEGIGLTFKTFGEIIVLMFQAIGSLFTKEGLNQVGGPVQVYSVSAQMASQGFLSYIWFLAIISVNLGFFNLLPIPGLDGARFYISIGEALTNKKFNTKVESYINMVGIFFLFGLMILVTVKDIFMLF